MPCVKPPDRGHGDGREYIYHAATFVQGAGGRVFELLQKMREEMTQKTISLSIRWKFARAAYTPPLSKKADQP
jgi:hypothetical protein